MGSGSRSRQRSSTRDITPGEFRGEFRDDLAGGLSDIISTGGVRFKGKKVAPILPIETARLKDLDDSVSALLADSSGVVDFLGRTISGEFLTPESNPFLQETIDFLNQDLSEEFDQRDLEARSLFSRSGQNLQDSSPFSNTRALLGRAEADAKAQATAGVLSENFARERVLQSEAVNQSLATASFLLTAQIENLKAQALPRLIQDLGIERGISLFNTRVNSLLAALQVSAGLADVSGGGFGKGTSSRVGVLS